MTRLTSSSISRRSVRMSLQRIFHLYVLLELIVTDSGKRTARSLFTDDGNDEIDAEDLMVTIEDELDVGDADD